MTRLRVIEFVAPSLGVLAHGLGLFDAAGIEVDAVRTRSSTEQRAGLMDGTYDLGLTAIDNLIAWDADGDDLVVVAQVERTTVLDLCAAPDVGAIAELRGRTLAVDAVDTGFAILLRHVLATHGLAPDKYELLPAGGIQQRMEAVIEGRAAAGSSDHRSTTSPSGAAAGSSRAPTRRSRDCRGSARCSGPPRRPRPGSGEAYVRALAGAAAWATDDREEEAVRMLEAAGFDREGAVQLFAIRARTVAPAGDGIALLYEMRRDLGMLPAGAPPAEALVSPMA